MKSTKQENKNKLYQQFWVKLIPQEQLNQNKEWKLQTWFYWDWSRQIMKSEKSLMPPSTSLSSIKFSGVSWQHDITWLTRYNMTYNKISHDLQQDITWLTTRYHMTYNKMSHDLQQDVTWLITRYHMTYVCSFRVLSTLPFWMFQMYSVPSEDPAIA